MNSFPEVWASLPDALKVKLWNACQDTYKESLWLLLDDPHKKGLWLLLDDPQKEALWLLLNDSQKQYLWNFLEINQKVGILEILSRAYSLAHVVFSTRKIIEERLKQEKQFKEYGFTNVYVYLEESDGTMPNGKKACVYSRVKKFNDTKSLHLRISYDTTGGTVVYDDTGCILKQCVRFLIGHEAGHIILDLEDIVKNALKDKQHEMSELQEKEATFFANIISDLRDLHILKRYGNLSGISFPNKETVINRHKIEIEESGINSEKIVKYVSDLNKESKYFTMSNSIFATKKVMSIVYGKDNHRISQIFPCKIGSDVAHICCFKPQEQNTESFGYRIALPKENVNVETDSSDIANAIGVLLLHYDVIEGEESENPLCQIPIDDNRFHTTALQIFSKCLSDARKFHLNNFSKKIMSKQRILNMANIVLSAPSP
jgi:hypothetical protein